VRRFQSKLAQVISCKGTGEEKLPAPASEGVLKAAFSAVGYGLGFGW
jgi:hypothetical protein